MGMNYLLYVRSNTWSGGSMGPDHAHHHAPLYNCLRIRNQQFGKSFEWMITTVEMGCSNEWTKSFLSGLDDWVDLSLLLLLLLPAPVEWGQSFAFTSHHIVARCWTRKLLCCRSHQSLLICQVSPGRCRELLPDKCWIPAPWSPHSRNEMIIRANYIKSSNIVRQLSDYQCQNLETLISIYQLDREYNLLVNCVELIFRVHFMSH